MFLVNFLLALLKTKQNLARNIYTIKDKTTKSNNSIKSIPETFSTFTFSPKSCWLPTMTAEEAQRYFHCRAEEDIKALENEASQVS